MKKIIPLTVVLFILLSQAAWPQTYKIGNNVVSAGVGLGGSLGNYSHNAQTPAFSVQYERGIWEIGPGVVSLGGYVGTKTYKYSYSDPYYGSGHYESKWTYTIVGVRGAYHYTGLTIPNLDVYAGVMASYNAVSYKDNSGSSLHYGSTVGATGFVGGRYFFAKILGGFAELGYGVSYLNVGLCLKF